MGQMEHPGGDSTSAPIKSGSSTIAFQEEKVQSTWWDALPLLSKNHSESGALGSDKFDPHYGGYQDLETKGLLRVFTMRDGKQLVGYAIFLITPHMHYPSTTWAYQDVMYVAPEHRGRKACEFMIWCDTQLHIAAINYVYRHVSSSGKDYGRTLERMGYKMIERGFLKEL